VEIEGSVTPFRAAADNTPTVVIANRNEMARAGIESLLQASGYRIIAGCSHEHDLFRCSEAYLPNIILMADNIAPQEEVARMILRLRADNRSVMIILLLEESHAIAAADLLDLGLEGILLSTARARTVVDCVENVRHDRKWVDPNLLHHLTVAERPPQTASALTSREADIAHLVSRGLHNKQIARELDLTEGTVKMHLHHIYEKLRLNGRTQLALSMTGSIGHKVRPAGEPTAPDPAASARFQPKNVA
jgi:DNA-binding NarL/FixJ family response regulator